MSGSYTYAGKHTTQNERFGIYGISERKEQFDNIPKMGEYEVCVPKPRILVQGVLCGHSREKYCSHKGVYRKPIKARLRKATN